MQNSSAFQYLALDTIHESLTNPRRTFEESKLQELAASIREHGLIQPITVRPNASGFEIVAGARRFRAAQLADLFAVPARIVEIGDAAALGWALAENAMREDVHPYEEAQGLQQLLDFPGYDVAALVAKTGKSTSHIYARLSLLQLIPEIAKAFTEDRTPPATPTSSPAFPRRRRRKPTPNAGAKTGRTRRRTYSPPGTSPRGFRPTSIFRLPMRRSTAKTPP